MYVGFDGSGVATFDLSSICDAPNGGGCSQKLTVDRGRVEAIMMSTRKSKRIFLLVLLQILVQTAGCILIRDVLQTLRPAMM